MNKSIQKKLGRIRPPRVHITYDLETDGAIIKKELPFVLGVIADLTGYRPEVFKLYDDRKFVFVDQDNLNDVFRSMTPMVKIVVKFNNENTEMEIPFLSIDDFKPNVFLYNVPLLNDLFVKKNSLTELSAKLLNNKLLRSAYIDHMIHDSELNYIFFNDEQKNYFIELIKVSKNLKIDANNLFESLQNNIKIYTDQLNDLFDQILHHPDFQRLEGSWAGIKYLVSNMEIGEHIKLRVFNCNIQELRDDLNNVLEFDQSYLFKLLYEEEYGTYGGAPYTSLIIDTYIEKSQLDFLFLMKISQVVACAHIPTSIGVNPSLFDLNCATELYNIRDMNKVLNSIDMVKFRSFRESEDSKYISLIFPRFLARAPYDMINNPLEKLNYNENTIDHKDFLWSNAVYVHAQRIADSFAQCSWFLSIVGPENGGMVNNLPVFNYKSVDGDLQIKCPTEIIITDRREKELSDNGFISLCYCKDSDYAVFFSGQSTYKPPLFNKDTANANASLSSRFQCILVVSRFAHYLKCMIRDKIGSFISADELESYLQNWIADYILLNETSDQEIKAKYPLQDASVKVFEDAAKPGKYSFILYLKPMFQLEELTISLRLVSKIPGGE